jgi:prolyl-tRNA synthetase
MRQTQLFTKTLKEAPSDETARNAQLLIRAGYVHKELAGVYQFLPLGLRVIEKIKQIIREEMNGIGSQEMLATTLQSKEVWERTEEQHDAMYAAQTEAYTRIFDRVGIGDDTYVTFADGGAFTQFSHEFQTVCEAGEDITYINKEKGIAINEEVLEKADLAEMDVTREELTETKTAEVGNIFNFGG